MTPDTAKLFIPFVIALSEGKTIQTGTVGTWVDLKNPSFLGDPTYYRIKPEPLEFWAVVWRDGSIGRRSSKQEAIDAMNSIDKSASVKKFREVIEE